MENICYYIMGYGPGNHSVSDTAVFNNEHHAAIFIS